MTMLETINQKLSSSLLTDHIHIVDESHMHNTPNGSESHFKVTIISSAFENKMPVKRHQMVYTLLTKEMQSIHALALHTYTPKEWQSNEKKIPSSPDCLGGSKAT